MTVNQRQTLLMMSKRQLVTLIGRLLIHCGPLGETFLAEELTELLENKKPPGDKPRAATGGETCEDI